jgi:hypothetical protein
MSHYFKYKFNPSQQVFSKAKSSTSNLVPYLDIVCLPVAAQHQVCSINVDIKSEFDLGTYFTSRTLCSWASWQLRKLVS